MEQVKVVLYDDVHYHADNSLVEADASHILELGGRRVKLDLTAANFNDLAAQLEQYLAAGSPVTTAHAGVSKLKGRRSGPQDRGRMESNRAVRLWAAWQGRVPETQVPTGYYYKVGLRKDVTAWLNERGMTPGEFIVRAEKGEYPPKKTGKI